MTMPCAGMVVGDDEREDVHGMGIVRAGMGTGINYWGESGRINL